MKAKIPTYIINLKKREDRRKHIFEAFKGKNEFNLNLFTAIESSNGAVGLWYSIKTIISEAKELKYDYVLICEDDHAFTQDYNKHALYKYIETAKKRNVKILSGGVSWYDYAVQIEKKLFWLNLFNGTQFMIIFSSFYNDIVNAELGDLSTADVRLAEMSNNTIVMYPFISVQKEFGYSDVTKKNGALGYVSGLFSDRMRQLEKLNLVNEFYKINFDRNRTEGQEIMSNNFGGFNIPVYIINLRERNDRLIHIKEQFEGKIEFEINLIQVHKNSNGALGLWNSIITAIKIAKNKEEDVIIICEDDHQFTSYYSKEILFNNIVEAANQGVKIMLGGISNFYQAIPVASNRAWIDFFQCTQFTIVFKEIYDDILNETFDQHDAADLKLSAMTNHKMVFYPYISTQKDFGYSDIPIARLPTSKYHTLFERSEKKLKKIYEIKMRHKLEYDRFPD